MTPLHLVRLLQHRLLCFWDHVLDSASRVCICLIEWVMRNMIQINVFVEIWLISYVLMHSWAQWRLVHLLEVFFFWEHLVRWVIVSNRGIVEEIRAQMLLLEVDHRWFFFEPQTFLVVVLNWEQFKFLSLQISHLLFFCHLSKGPVTDSGLWLTSCISSFHKSVALLKDLLDFFFFVWIVEEWRLVHIAIMQMRAIYSGVRWSEQVWKSRLIWLGRLKSRVNLFRHVINIGCMEELPDILTYACLLIKQMPCMCRKTVGVLIVVLLLVSVIVVVVGVHDLNFLILN